LQDNRDDFFIDQLLLPLIKNEKTIPISLVEGRQAKELKQDGSNWHINYDVLITEALSASTESKVKPEDNKTFCPSSLFDKPFRKDLVKVMLEKQGEESQEQASKLLNSKWSLVHENTVNRPGPTRF
jgi:hypothetical protein